MILWENFNLNEIYVMLLLFIGFTAYVIVPSVLPKATTLLFLVWGFAISTIFDFTIGGGLIDFYKVNDVNSYELTDLLSYFAFAPFSYFFIYLYEKFLHSRTSIVLYILGWTMTGLLMEKLSTSVGAIHYQHGYVLWYSVPVFLVVLTSTALLYEMVKKYDRT
ncbi:hypothetical protein [Bacillus sp. 2205SS5-2]|uniref:hypothetical protein n=1 Tax=Bacillus sp. 2205SS5-2 TaxID=3109031 RepID=UPI0030042F73